MRSHATPTLMNTCQEFSPPLNRDDLVIAIATLIFLIFAYASIGCTSLRGGPEPKWAPAFYNYAPQDGRCTFYSKISNHRIDCDEPLIFDHVLLPADSMIMLQKKFNACVEWEK